MGVEGRNDASYQWRPGVIAGLDTVSDTSLKFHFLEAAPQCGHVVRKGPGEGDMAT